MRSTPRRTTGGRARLGATLAGVLALATLTPGIAAAAGTGDPAGTVSNAAGDSVSTDFTISSFNVLGSSHTRNSARFATGVERIPNVVRLLEKHSVDVVGFQEMQADQMQAFLDRTAGRYGVYPGLTPVGTRNRVDPDNTIAWDATQWQRVEARSVEFPYFDGKPRPMPVVKLRNLQTGMTAWFTNIHTPATNRQHPGQDAWRAQAIAQEVQLARQLRASRIPVFVTGDMNEREKAFCPMTADGRMRAARGGTNRNGVCDAKHPWYVDWIFGTKRLSFTGYVEDVSPLVKRTTDHPVVAATAHIDPLKFPHAFMPAPDPGTPLP